MNSKNDQSNRNESGSMAEAQSDPGIKNCQSPIIRTNRSVEGMMEIINHRLVGFRQRE